MSLKNQNIETKEKKSDVEEDKAVAEQSPSYAKVVKAFASLSAEERVKAYNHLKPAINADLHAISVGDIEKGTEEYDKL